MKVELRPTTLDDLRERLSRHLCSLPSAIDAFFEGHILASADYDVLLSGVTSGFVSVHQEGLITQFSLEPRARPYGQDVFAQVCRLDAVQAALVLTCDEFFLSHALDAHRHLSRQAYLFTAPAELPDAPPGAYWLRPAAVTDVGLIERGAGDFFGGETELRRKAEERELFLLFAAATCVGVGLIEPSRLMAEVVSVGMFVFEPFRRQGAATATLQLLVRECRRVGQRPVAGCWVGNHPSKRSLERAGLFAQARLLRIEL